MDKLHSEVQLLQSQKLVPTHTQIGQSGIGLVEESKKTDEQLTQESSDYVTAKELQDEEFKNYEDNQDNTYSGYATKIQDSYSKNSTKGWVIYATENSNFPPRIQYICKLILKAIQQPDKITNFYSNLNTRGFKDNTIIALKSL